MNSIRKLMILMCVVFVTFFLMINLSYGQQTTVSSSNTVTAVEKAPGSGNQRSTSSTEVKQYADERKDLDRNYWITFSYSDNDIPKEFTFVLSKRTFRLEYTFPGTLNSINFYGRIYKIGENMFALEMDFSSRKPLQTDKNNIYIDKKIETNANLKLDEELTLLNAGEKDLKIKMMISKNPPRNH